MEKITIKTGKAGRPAFNWKLDDGTIISNKEYVAIQKSQKAKVVAPVTTDVVAAEVTPA